VVVLFAGLVSLCAASLESDLFLDFVVKYQKPYFLNGNVQEYNARFEIFKANLQYISEHNAQNSGYTLGVNHFADTTHEELASVRTVRPVRRAQEGGITSSPVLAPPPTFDWRDKGVVGPVEEQGQCGSPFIYTVVGSIASTYAVNKKTTFKALAVNQIINCTEGKGCDGGDSEDIVSYVTKYGLYFADSFDGKCPSGVVDPGVCILGSGCTVDHEDLIAQVLVNNGPLYVGFDASQASFELYQTGIYNDPKCSNRTLDHSLLLVGYNANAWIAQNTWGQDWGMKGYIYIARGRNTCGIATEVCFPVKVTDCA